MVRLNVKFQKVAFPALYFRLSKLWYQELRLPGRVCSENIIVVPQGVEGGGGSPWQYNEIDWWKCKDMVIKPRKSCHGCNPTLQTCDEGGVGERRTQGLGVRCWARWRDAEVDEEAVLCVFFFLFHFSSDRGKIFFFFFFPWLSSSDWRIRATWNLCKSGTIHPTKTKPHYGPAACQPDENKWVCIQKMGFFMLYAR